VLREDDQSPQLLAEVPHEARVIDVFFHRALIARVEEDRVGLRGPKLVIVTIPIFWLEKTFLHA
jgi:hypothetical protein